MPEDVKTDKNDRKYHCINLNTRPHEPLCCAVAETLPSLYLKNFIYIFKLQLQQYILNWT